MAGIKELLEDVLKEAEGVSLGIDKNIRLGIVKKIRASC